MIKFFDFTYYYIYQLNRKGYKKNNHELASGFLAMVYSTWISMSTIMLKAILDLIMSINILIIFFSSSAATYILVYYFAKKLYGLNGTRNFIVKEYDKKYSYKKQNRYLQTFILWIITCSWLLFCVIMFRRMQSWFAE